MSEKKKGFSHDAKIIAIAIAVAVSLGFSFEFGRWIAAKTLPETQASVYEVKYVVSVDGETVDQ